MSLLLFEGSAGTGKTTKLLEALCEHLVKQPLSQDQRVLVLTKMHGSRRRMTVLLNDKRQVRQSANCMTIDSFAGNLVRRWRTLVRAEADVLPEDGDFKAISCAAGRLLTLSSIGSWVTRRYPVIVVDEMQDCSGGELEILRGLAVFSYCYCAADGFQDLSGTGENEAVSWARSMGVVEVLTTVHRTKEPGLVDAASALRSGTSVPTTAHSSFEIISVPTEALGASVVSWRLRGWGQKGLSPVAVVSPTKRGTSSFVDNLIGKVSAKQASSRKGNAKAGPFPTTWESGDDEVADVLLAEMKLPEDPEAAVGGEALTMTAGQAGAGDVCDWLYRQKNIGGRTSFTAAEVREEVRRIVQRRRAFGYTRPMKRFALTVHQAKNREFDSVIVLWPLSIKSNIESQRRLLYNAITRAKQRALVIVQDPKKNRLSQPPFLFVESM